MPERSTALMCTKASACPSSRVIKPKAAIALKNLTVPVERSPVLTLRSFCALFNRDHVTDNFELSGRNLAAAIDQLELELLTFGQTFQARRVPQH